MKALVLAGGCGTRLRPITYTSSKQLVPIANKPIIFYVLEQIQQVGIKQVGVIIGDNGEEIEEVLGNGSAWGLELTYIKQNSPLGIAHAVLIAGEFLGDEDFILYLGDNLVREGIRDFVSLFNKKKYENFAAQILLAQVPDPQRFGVVVLDHSNRVQLLEEKPQNPQSNLALVGVYIFNHLIHEAVKTIKPSQRGELEITDAIQWLVNQGRKVNASVVEGYWKDLGELDAILDGNSLMLESLEYVILGDVDDESSVDSRVYVDSGAVVKSSKIRGPVIVGKNTEIIDSYIGPFTSIGNNCKISGSEIEHSMVLDGCCISGSGRIEDSLIGKSVEITRSEKKPRASRLMIGDHSKVEMS